MSLGPILKDFLVYGIGDFLVKAATFLTLPIYTRLLTPAEYGIWSYILTALGLFSGILILGGDSAFARYYFEAKTDEERQSVTSTWLGFLFAWSLLVVAVMLPLTPLLSRWSFESASHASLFALALLSAPLSLLNSLCGQALRNTFKPRLFIALNLASTLLTLGLSLWGLLGMKLGLAGLLGGALLAQAIIAPIRLWTIRALLRPRFSGRLLKDLLAYGLPLVPVSLAYWIFVSSDRVVLGKLSSLEQVGLYTVASNLAGALSVLQAALAMAWSPHALRLFERSPEEASAMYGRMLNYVLLGFGIVAVGLSAFAHELVVMMATPAFLAASLAIAPLALGIVAQATTQVTALGISLRKKTGYLALYAWLAALLNLGLNLLLIPRWGMVAAAWTTAAAYVLLTLAYFATSQRLQPIVWDRYKVGMGSMLILGFTALAPWLPGGSAGAILLKLLYCFSFGVLLCLLRVLDRRDWGAVATWVGERRGRQAMEKGIS
jgi:Membrane protein involved in the export of O-antigen and teichoic acid